MRQGKKYATKQIPRFSALKKAQQGMAETFEEKVNLLRETFPPFPQADQRDNEEAEYAAPIPRDSPISEEEVTRAELGPKLDKASGTNELRNQCLRIDLKRPKTSLTHLFQVCLDGGYHPRGFKKAGNTLETIIAKLRSEYWAENSRLLAQWMGVRRSRSRKQLWRTY